MQSALPQPGAAVWIRGQRWRVTRVRGDRHVVRLDVTGESGRQAFLYPFDRPTELREDLRPVRVRPQRARARLALLAGRTFGRRTLSAAVDARAAILPYQLEPALAALGGARRILIADEVGLGKTVQAGLIAAEIIRRDAPARVLVVVPAALAAQWADELRARFGLTCVPADRGSFDRRARERAFGDNPWNGAGIFLTSLDFLKQPHVLEGMPARAWDLVVIDEAHTACGHSDRHAAVHDVARRSRCVVLLTATPHSGDEHRFSRLLSLGELAGDQPIVFRRRRSDLGVTSRRRTAWHHVSLSQAELRVFASLGAFERLVLKAASSDHRDEARLLLAILRKRALSTMRALSISIERRLAWLSSANPVEPADSWVQARLDLGGDEAEDVASQDDLLGLRARTGLERDTERSWLKRLAHLAGAAAGHESKVRRVVSLVSRTDEPVIVFTEFRDSLTVLVNRIRLFRPVSVLHGGMTADERAETIGRFQTGSDRVLIATDVAGQGLNLQHRCRWVISLELPWNPARLEQRIGRVDRIGQQRPVHFTLLVARHDSEMGLIAHLARRVLTANRTLKGASLIEVPMSEEAVRAAVIDGTPIESAAPPAAVSVAGVKSARVARRAARQIELRRRLVTQWRGPERSGRPIRTHRAPVACAVFSVPFLDGSGAVAEMHLAAVPFGGPFSRDLVDKAGRGAVARLLPRLERLRRLAAASLAQRIQTERALADEMRPATGADVQPGLFDAAALRALETARAGTDDIDRQLDATIARLRLAADVEPGRPLLEILWLPPP